MKQKYAYWFFGGLVLFSILAMGWLYNTCIDTQVVGFIHDDSIYAITAKALAEGKGFHLIHLVTQPPQVKYPMVYPLLLASLWKLFPQFPQNLILLSQATLAFFFSEFGCFI